MKRELVILLTAVMFLTFAGSAWADTIVVSGSLSESDPTYNRAISGGGSLSTVGTDVFYDVYSVSGSAMALFTIIAETNSNGDSFLSYYWGPFDPASPLMNIYAADDDGGPDPGLDARLTGTVRPGIPGFLVVSSFANGATFDYTLTVTWDQLVTVLLLEPVGTPSTPVPEPSTMLLLGSGLLGLAGYGRRKFFNK